MFYDYDVVQWTTIHLSLKEISSESWWWVNPLVEGIIEIGHSSFNY